MKHSYSRYAQDAHLMIQTLNDELQIYIDRFYSRETYTDEFFHELKKQICIHMDDLNDVLINYFTHIQDYYFEIDDNQNFRLSNKFENLIDIQLDITNANFNAKHFSDITNSAIMKYINLKLIYENIIADRDRLNMPDDLNDKRVYSNENVLMILDLIFSEFYECFESLKSLCLEETDILSIINYYIFNIQIISYIIEFVESIRLV